LSAAVVPGYNNNIVPTASPFSPSFIRADRHAPPPHAHMCSHPRTQDSFFSSLSLSVSLCVYLEFFVRTVCCFFFIALEKNQVGKEVMCVFFRFDFRVTCHALLESVAPQKSFFESGMFRPVTKGSLTMAVFTLKRPDFLKATSCRTAHQKLQLCCQQKIGWNGLPFIVCGVQFGNSLLSKPA
jgi:hypothetical protein